MPCQQLLSAYSFPEGAPRAPLIPSGASRITADGDVRAGTAFGPEVAGEGFDVGTGTETRDSERMRHQAVN